MPEGFCPFGGCPVSRPILTGWTKEGGLGSPQRPFGYFSGEGKVPRGSGAEPPLHRPQPEGRQPKLDSHRTDYEAAGGLKEIQWLPGIKADTDWLDKRRGPGVSPAVFPPTFGRPKVGPPEANPRPGAGQPPGKEAANGAPSSIPPGGLLKSPHIRTPASLPPLSSASLSARSPPPPPGG